MAWTPPDLQQSARTAGAALVIAAAIAAVGFLAAKLALLSLALFGALLLTALLWPVARGLERWRVPRSIASFAAVALAIAVVAGGIAWVIPKATRQIAANRDRVVDNASKLLERAGARLPGGGAEDPAGAAQKEVTQYLGENTAQVASGVLGGLVTATEVAGGLLLALVLAFFFLRDGEALAKNALDRLPEDRRSVFAPALARAFETLRAWIRAAAVIALADAVGIGIGLALIGVPLAFSLALLTFLGGFIPVVGATVAGAVAVLVAWATGGTTDALLALAVVLAVQQLEGNVLEPVVMGRALPLHPAAVLVVVTIGALLGGIPGAFAAVPLAAMAVTFIGEVRARAGPERTRARPPPEPVASDPLP